MSRPAGFSHTPETIASIRAANTGRKYPGAVRHKHSEATRRKMCESSKLRWSKQEEHDKVSGENSLFWKGGIYQGESGYVILADGEYEHRTVMSKHLGRPLLSEEVVHHKNRIRSDNRIENLQLFANHSEHIIFHAQDDWRFWCSQNIPSI